MTSKHLLRQHIRQQSWAQPQEDDALLARFLALPQVAQAQSLCLYYGVGQEIATAPLLPALWALGKTVALPVCLPQRQMEARIVTQLHQLEPGPFQIPQPKDDCPVLEWGKLDVLLVPALCYDRDGYRLGQGGGYYDRVLAQFCGFTVGLCRDALLQDQVPREPHDRPVRLVVTTHTVFPPHTHHQSPSFRGI